MRDLNIAGLRQAITNKVVTFASKLLANGTRSFLNVTGTLPTIPTNNTVGILFNITSAGNTVHTQLSQGVLLNSGFTGAGGTAAIYAFNGAGGTLGDIVGGGGGVQTNIGVYGESFVADANTHVGVMGRGRTSTGIAIGVVGRANETTSTNTNIGGIFAAASGTINIGAYVTFTGASALSYTTTALLVDNNNVAAPILICRDNGSSVFTIDDGGDIKLLRTITPAGTTGNQTINKPSGTVNIAAGGTSVTVTNNLVNTDSIIHVVMRTNDVTAQVISVVAAAGSFVINTVACTAETSFGFLVTN